MAKLGALKKLKLLAKNGIKKIGKFIKNKLPNIVSFIIKALKSKPFDVALKLIQTIFPQAKIPVEIFNKIKLILDKVDEDKLKSIIQDVLKGDFSKLNEAIRMFIPSRTSNNSVDELNDDVELEDITDDDITDEGYEQYFGKPIN